MACMSTHPISESHSAQATVSPALWIVNELDAAVEFYTSTFREVELWSHVPGLAADLSIHGRRITLIAGDDTHSINPSISGLLHFDISSMGGEEEARAYIDELYPLLSAGGVLMGLAEYPFSPYFAWVRDPFGFTWQLMLTDSADATPKPFFVPAFMFGGPNHGNCEKATDYWISLFQGRRMDMIRYGAGAELEEGAVMLTYFELGGEVYAAMDSGNYHQFTFSPGVSLMVSCEGQEDIDRYWSALSKHPEQERCGWCADEWGVSWQIIPRSIGEIMGNPANQKKLFAMGKIILSEFE